MRENGNVLEIKPKWDMAVRSTINGLISFSCEKYKKKTKKKQWNAVKSIESDWSNHAADWIKLFEMKLFETYTQTVNANYSASIECIDMQLFLYIQ